MLKLSLRHVQNIGVTFDGDKGMLYFRNSTMFSHLFFREMKDLTFGAFRRLLFARLGPTLAALKLLSLGKVQINLAFRSLIRNFAGQIKKITN